MFNQENLYILQAFLVMFLALLVDLFQKKILRTLLKKVERTRNKLDDAVLLSIPRPLSAVIWITGITFTSEIIHKATGALWAIKACSGWFLAMGLDRTSALWND